MDKLNKTFRAVFEGDRLIKMIFSRKRSKALPYEKISLRPVMSGGSLRYQASYFFEKKVTHTNIEPDQAAEFCLKTVEDEFKQVNIFTEKADIQIMASRADDPKVLRKAPTLKLQDLSHNREKKYIIPDGIPCDFLIRLGVMDKDGNVFPRRYSKFRQINRYLEIIDDVFPYVAKDDADHRFRLRKSLSDICDLLLYESPQG